MPLAATKARDSGVFEQHPDGWYREASWPWQRLFERLTSLLAPIQRYAKIALRLEIDIGDGEIGEMIHGGLRHSLRTQDLRAIRDAELVPKGSHA